MIDKVSRHFGITERHGKLVVDLGDDDARIPERFSQIIDHQGSIEGIGP